MMPRKIDRHIGFLNGWSRWSRHESVGAKGSTFREIRMGQENAYSHSRFLPTHEGIEGAEINRGSWEWGGLKNRNVPQMKVSKMVYGATVKAEVPLNHEVGVYPLSGYLSGD